MPNIIITEFCNLNCPYCFADSMMKDLNNNVNEITMLQLQNILSWLQPTAIKQDFSIGIIGGEPTLHSNFIEILNYINNFCSITNSNSTLFTNGIYLYKYLPYIGKNMSILININYLQNKNLKYLYKSLEQINQLKWFDDKKVTLGCNLYINESNYDYFWNIISMYRNISQIRISVTAPIDEKLKLNKELYYLKMKPILLSFLNKAKNFNLSIIYDCNQIPKCMFTANELLFIESFGDYESFCTPIIDITPEFKASSCFGCYQLIDCSKFETFEQLHRYFQNKIFQKTLKNKINLCENCSKINLLQCQGGCLSFAPNI